MERIGHRIKRYRKHRSWTQAKLAKAAGFDHRYVSKLERGRRQPSAFDLSRLAAAFGLRIESIAKGTDWGLLPENSDFERIFRTCQEYVPSLEREPADRFRRARLDFPGLTKKLDEQVVVRGAETLLPVLSSREALFCLHLLAGGGRMEKLSPQRCGFVKFPVVEPHSRAVVGAMRHPSIAIFLADSHPHVFFPNVTLSCKSRIYVLDFLVGGKRNGTTVWFDLEIDGEGHEDRGDWQRQKDLGLPTIRLKVDQLRKEDCLALVSEVLLNEDTR